MDKLSYAIGLGIGNQLADLGATQIVVADFAQAITDILSGNEPQLPQQEAQQLVSAFLRSAEQRKQAQMAEAGKAARKAGEQFLAGNKSKPGILTTPSRLQYEIIREGEGRKPKATDRVICHYEGRLIDGTVFDSSYKRGEPATFPLNGVIAGWTEGLQLMGEGAHYRFYIPFNLAYGSQGAGGMIPPYAALIFDVELLEVI